MKKLTAACLLLALLLAACAPAPGGAASGAPESGSAAPPASPEASASVPGPESSSEGASSLQAVSDDMEFAFYESLADIPYASVAYAYEKGQLTLNGEPWIDAPGDQKFGDIAYSNSEYLFIQVFFPNGEFRWMGVQYDEDMPQNAYFLPSVSDGQHILRAENGQLVFENGGIFDPSSQRWIENGKVMDGRTYRIY